MADQNRSALLAANYKRLAASAQNLAAATDEFSKPIKQLDDALKPLNLNLTTWHRVSGGEDSYDNYWRRDVGYARIGRIWGLAIRTSAGHVGDPESETVEQWSFGDAPRSYQIEALEGLPELLEALIKSADKTARKLKEKTGEAQALAEAVKAATEEVAWQKKGLR
jgi:hypothetical protein